VNAGGGSSITYGSISSIPSTCTTGALYVITSGMFDPAICTATNTWTYYYNHRPVIPMSKLGLTASGTSGPTLTTTNGYAVINAPLSGSANLFLAYWTAPATPYTVTFPFWVSPITDIGNYRQWFFGWTDGTTGYQGLQCGTGNGSYSSSVGCRIMTMGMNGTFGATQGSINLTWINAPNSVRYVQLSNDGTTLTAKLCADWDNCVIFGSVTASTNFPGGNPGKLAIGANNQVTSGSPLVFTVVGQQ
jgi:hypothetical protein